MKKVFLYIVIVIMLIVAVCTVGYMISEANRDVSSSVSATAEAAETAETDENNELYFEEISNQNWNSYIVYREKTTDVMYLNTSHGTTVMLDPETGLPLTYTNWKVKYQNK